MRSAPKKTREREKERKKTLELFSPKKQQIKQFCRCLFSLLLFSFAKDFPPLLMQVVFLSNATATKQKQKH